jgi:hypothetical protein
MKKLTLTAAIALAATALYTPHASAQDVNAGATDLVLGFRVNDGLGMNNATDLEIDLGSEANFTASTTLTIPDAVIASDLVATYGANWATRTDLTWGVAGLVASPTGSGPNKTFAFDVTSSQGVKTAEINSASDFTTALGNITNLANGLDNAMALGTDSKAAQIGNSTTTALNTSGSYTNLVSDQGKFDGDYGYSQFSGPTNATSGQNGATEVNSISSNSPIGADELYEYTASKTSNGVPGTDLGTFSLDAAGDFTFTGVNAVAAPEPSTYALMAGAMGFLFLAVRRRRSNV